MTPVLLLLLLVGPQYCCCCCWCGPSIVVVVQVWDLITLNAVHTIDNISQSWVRALVYDRRKVSTNTFHSFP